MDFPGEQCNSIVFTKYPNPNIDDAFGKFCIKLLHNIIGTFTKTKQKENFGKKFIEA
jgi:hypothetical protein